MHLTEDSYYCRTGAIQFAFKYIFMSFWTFRDNIFRFVWQYLEQVHRACLYEWAFYAFVGSLYASRTYHYIIAQQTHGSIETIISIWSGAAIIFIVVAKIQTLVRDKIGEMLNDILIWLHEETSSLCFKVRVRKICSLLSWIYSIKKDLIGLFGFGLEWQ